MVLLCVKSSPKTPDHTNGVTHASVVSFCPPAPVVTRSSRSDKSVKVVAELPNVGFSSDAFENSQFMKRPEGGLSGQLNGSSTGLSMELCGVSLSPNGHSSPERPVGSVKHCLDFEDSDGCERSPKILQKSTAIYDEQNVCESSTDNCVKSGKSPAAAEADCDRGRPRKNVVFHASMPISVSESQRDPDDVPVITPVTKRSHRFLVCYFFVLIYRVAQNEMSHQTKSNFSTADGDFLCKISGFKAERFFNLKN